MSDPVDRTIDASESLAQRSAARAEYDAEFDPDAAPNQEAAKAEIARLQADVSSLLGPSTRTIIQRIELEFRKKIRSLDNEIAEMMQREVALKESNRVALEHNKKLADERDALQKLTDPDDVIRNLREEAGKFKTLYEGEAKTNEELRAKLAIAKGHLEALQGAIHAKPNKRAAKKKPAPRRKGRR